MKSAVCFFISLLLLLSNTACEKDFLDVPDKTSIIRQQYVVDLNTTQHFLNGIYVEVASNFYFGPSLIYPDLIADNIKPVIGSGALTAAYDWKQQADEDQPNRILPDNINANGAWFSGYRIIRDCSFVLETVDKYRDQGQAKADDMKGQAYAIRALVHFALVNIFAQPYGFSAAGSHQGIPYVTTSDWEQPVSRQTVAQVYDKIIEDFNNAIQSMSPATENKTVMNRNAAKALLARTYLFKGDYNLAKNLSREVATIVPIMAGTDYPSKLFTPEESEALFQLGPAAMGVSAGAGNYHTNFAGQYFTMPQYTFNFTATNDIASVLKERESDVRSKWVKKEGTEWHIVKYPVDVVPGFALIGSSYYQTLVRSSEMYLTAAESYAKLGGTNEDSARFYLNAIRKRADPSAMPSTATGTSLLEDIYTERRKELAFEGLRMFDLLRWKKGVNRSIELPAGGRLPYPSNKAIAPIPLLDVRISGLQQNEGY